MELDLSTLAKHFSDEAAAWELVERMRWPDGPVCPHCGDRNRAYFLKPRNGTRTTSTGRTTYRRLWKCKACRKPFSCLVGTIFERTQVPLSKWLLTLYLMSASKNGIAANELRRVIGVTQPTAWFMLHRLREAMRVASFTTMRGTIVADEAWIGGDPGRMNAKTRARWEGEDDPEPIVPGSIPNQRTAKTPVLSLVNATTGEVRSQVVPDVTGATLRKAIAQHVDMGNSVLWTDEGSWYEQLGREFIAHNTVNHSEDEYVDFPTGATTNHVENFFSQLKRSIDGTHHHVSKEHLHRYLAEHDFRFSTCKISDSARMERIIDQAEGRRLTYRRVTEEA